MSSAPRPLSPHIQVYRPQITSLLSIAHRISGIGLAAGAVLLVWQLVAAASGPAAFDGVQSFIGSWLGLTLLVAWSGAFFYHLANGIRHLVWDAGYGLALDQAYLSARIVLGAAVVLTALAWILALIMWSL